MPKNRRVLLWDVGGTLVEFACSLPQSVRQRLAACGIDHSEISDQEIEKTYSDFLSKEQEWLTIEHERAAEMQWLATLVGRASLGGDAAEHFFSRLPPYFHLYRPVAGMIELLRELRRDQCAMAVISNWPPSLPGFLEHHGLSEFFDAIVYSATDGIHKPDAAIFWRALKMLGAMPTDAVFIGDNPLLDIAPATALGMRAVHFDPRRRCETCDAHDVPSLRRLIGMT